MFREDRETMAVGHRQRVGKGAIPHPRVPLSFTWDILYSLLQDLQSYLTDEESTRLRAIIRNHDILGYLELSEAWGLQSINLLDDNVHRLSARYQLATLLKKFPFPDKVFNRREAAIEKFFEAEKQCKIANELLIPRLSRSSEPDTLAVFTYARGFVSRILGQIPSWDLISRDCRHGPGATLSTSDGRNCSYYKYSEWPYDVTKAALPYAVKIIQQDERWLGALEDDYRSVFEIPKHHILDQNLFWSNVFNVVNFNRVTFVPKDVRIERTIAIEPTMNLYLQLGVDGFIRDRLKSAGVDLDKGQKKNRELARIGSITGDFSTIDLSAASDTVSLSLCAYMLPPIWYNYLMALRAPNGVLKETSIHYEKISSMGNGFTFALESLLFTSIVYGVTKHFLGEFRHQHFAVYGDDIIIRTEIAPLLVYYLGKSGFAVNPDKSFIQGRVRESCGADWLRGHPIRPAIIDKPITNLVELFAIRNRLRQKLEVSWYIFDSHTVRLMDKWVPESMLTLTGPPSNEDFSSYRHMSYPYGKTRKPNSFSWEIKYLRTKPDPQKGNQLFFRRLMNPLRGTNEYPWHMRIYQGGLEDVGGYYLVVARERNSRCIKTRVVNEWPPEYPAVPV